MRPINQALIAAAALSVFTALPALAQTASTSSAANNTANQITSSGAIAQGGSVVFPSQLASTTSQVENSGTATLKTAPSLGGLALGGGHPCAYASLTTQISIIGGGAGFGGMTVDSACMLMVQSLAAGDRAAYDAAIYMIAQRDPEACKAMRAVGRISASSSCGEKQSTNTVSASSNSGAASLPYSKCTYDRSTNRLVVRKKVGYSSAVARDACKASHGF